MQLDTDDRQLKFTILRSHGQVVARHPDFWVSGDVNVLGGDLPIGALRMRAKAALDGADCEKGLAGRAWFAHRGRGPFERTLEFVQAHDQVLRQFASLNANLGAWKQDFIKQSGHYLLPGELQHPWCEFTKAGKWRTSPRWTSYIAARRLADQFTLGYEEYLGAAFAAMNLRGWQFANTKAVSLLASPKLMGQEDSYLDATIPGIIVKRYEATPRRCEDAYFKAAAFAGHALQMQHLRFFAHELTRVYQAMAESKWRQYVRVGELPDVPFSVALAFGVESRQDS